MSANPYAAAAFLIAAFVIAGAAQTAWFGSSRSRAFAAPLDGGLTFRGRRVLGDHKTLRGFVVMVPAAACTFALLSLAAGDARGRLLWVLSPAEYAALGGWAALGFMAGELPNSFVKRQLGIEPGAVAVGTLARAVFLIVDRLDSTLGVLAVLVLAVPVPSATAAYVLLLGVAIHAALSVITFRLGGKARAA